MTLHLTDHTSFRVRLVDCVGYIVPSAVGYIEEEQPRMVRTPWYEEEIPFNMAAEIGTKKVIWWLRRTAPLLLFPERSMKRQRSG